MTGFIGHCGSQKHSFMSWEDESKNPFGNVAGKVGCWCLSSLSGVSVNLVEMSGSCWDDTFSTNVSDKWIVSVQRQDVLYTPFCCKLGFHNVDLVLWPHSILLYLVPGQFVLGTSPVCYRRVSHPSSLCFQPAF